MRKKVFSICCLLLALCMVFSACSSGETTTSPSGGDSNTSAGPVAGGDINGDGIRDRITRTRNENGTAHHYYQYKIELNNGGEFVDITPDEFRTVEGAECALAKIQFSFHPEFRAVKITRPWNVSWTTPTTATKIVYAMENQKLVPIERTEMKSVCDVTDLF